MNEPIRLPSPAPDLQVPRRLVTHTGTREGARIIPEETAIAFTYDCSSYAVMMATPADLEDFAIGFSLSEGIIASVDEIADLDVVRHPLGVELRMSLCDGRADALESRRRNLAGPAGCGLCGIESLAAAVRTPPAVSGDFRIAPATIFEHMAALRGAQPLNQETHAVHGAGFCSAQTNALLGVREDVGRHNALDKLIGMLARSGQRASAGFIVLTSRVSIELVQKAATVGCPMLVAVSAPTAYALRVADEAGMTLVAVARDDSFEVFTHAERVGQP